MFPDILKKFNILAKRRTVTQRRSGRDRRKLYDIHYLSDEEHFKRLRVERRSQPERRAGWKRVSKWGSVPTEEWRHYVTCLSRKLGVICSKSRGPISRYERLGFVFWESSKEEETDNEVCSIVYYPRHLFIGLLLDMETSQKGHSLDICPHINRSHIPPFSFEICYTPSYLLRTFTQEITLK